jgi:hypothetical protein
VIFLVFQIVKGLSINEVENLFGSISGSQAYDSEGGGDDDAEDNLPIKPSTPRSPMKRLHPEHDNGGTSSACKDSSDCKFSSEDSDDHASAIPNLMESSNFESLQVTENIVIPETSSSEGESEDADGQPGYKWVKTGKMPEHFKRVSFYEGYGPKVDINGKSTLQILSLFFCAMVWKNTVDQSNLYANNLRQNLNTSVEEMKTFVGMLIIMGFHQLSTMRLFWSSDPNFHVPRISSVMTVKRFLPLLRFLHLNDNNNVPDRESPNFDKLYKIRPIITLSNKNKSFFSPSRYISIDERMISFRGRSCMKQYMPMKPIKRGFKMWVAAHAVSGEKKQFIVQNPYLHTISILVGSTSSISTCHNTV